MRTKNHQKKPEIQSHVGQYFKNNKKSLLCGSIFEKIKAYLFPKSFTNPNSDIVVKAERMSLLRVSLLWGYTVHEQVTYSVDLLKCTKMLDFTCRMLKPISDSS